MTHKGVTICKTPQGYYRVPPPKSCLPYATMIVHYTLIPSLMYQDILTGKHSQTPANISEPRGSG